MGLPVFFDPTGRRSRWSKRAVALIIAVVAAGALAFASTLIFVRPEREISLRLPQPRASELRGIQPRHGWAAWLPHARRPVKGGTTPLSIGFYLPGDDASFSSLQRHAGSLDWVVPAQITVFGPTHQVAVDDEPRFDRAMGAMRDPPKVLPMVQNLADGEWDAAGATALLHDPVQRHALVTRLADHVVKGRLSGLMMDFEVLPPGAMRDYVKFLRELNAAMPQDRQLAVTVPAETDRALLIAFAKVCDRVILMAYDQHWQGGLPGPIASQDWFVERVATAERIIGGGKLVVALGSYAYDWHGGTADALTIEEAWLAAHESSAPVIFDRFSGNAGFAYEEDGGEQHDVWMLDAATSWNQFQALKRLGIGAIAMWRLGSEDPGFWEDLRAFRRGGLPDLTTPRSMLSTEVHGSGEILRLTARPDDGHRAFSLDKAGMITSETYTRMPTPFVVHRWGGGNPKLLALTFDDGPDPSWTPRILSILEKEKVPATFFVIGENALQHPFLLNRMIADGDEIGNHTYSHPNLAITGLGQTTLELNATQRLVEAYTGRSMRLFRAPYFGDAEPTTLDELEPALEAQKAGYTVVGLHVDPNDWQRPGANTIVQQVIDQVHAVEPDKSRNVILLHDGGGDRSQTVAALPRIIASLRSEGYTFVTASQLVGVPRAQAMPRVAGSDLAAVRTDVAIFVLLAAITAMLGWLFYLAIALGLGRAVLVAALATVQSLRHRPEPPQYEPTVSVIIPAYNEERVIVASVARVLASDYPALQVIVADDGSKDRTSELVQEAFADDPRVTLLTLANGGKASALNRALAEATGEIVIALDADTQFEPLTIRRLSRWFADPRIGAVAGDARVGNRVNLVTRWQAIEYITSQNLERRAFAGFDAMTVVPGAVGAWRRAALDSVGGYPEDTLAEDQDLTIAIQRAGWRVTYDPRAIAWTEAPESFKALSKQRFRWAFGTLQCLWKHSSVLYRGKPSGLALIGLPQAWLFQIAFAAISPLIDLALIVSIVTTVLRVHQHGWLQGQGDVWRMITYWCAFTAIDAFCGWVAYRLDGKGVRYPVFLLLAQRFIYRQIMYWVVLRAISSAIGGWVVGWGKLERSGRVGVGVTASSQEKPAR
ncbi:glycosyltransferase [Novosphingobium sp.]|uniref:glycosyltransferase n=1 Tax=Novosphingobium sp. TaxID=1874826 RepID=UPI002B465355|nr:glycosyltransferase [Novosphingobium sp.]HKR92009.1 glycosyltransferase [Novosphingobium sp.]